MSESKKTSRRSFLARSSAAAAGAALAGNLSIARTAHAAGSDTLRAVIIGCGGRGGGAGTDWLDADKRCRIVATADAFTARAQNVANMLKERYPDQVDIGDRIFGDLDCHEKAIAVDCDVVLNASPPGFRPLQYEMAIEAGKHVFMEKPVCVDAPGYRKVQAANRLADEKGLKVVVGLQRRHDPRYAETVQRIQEGALGDVMYTRVYWNGGGVWTRQRQPDQTEMEYQVNNWYYFVWLSGDHIAEQHVHNLDIGNWVMGDRHPVRANGMGGRQVRKGPDHGTIYDHHFIEFTYDDGTKMFSQCRHIPNTWSNVSEHAQGTVGHSNCNGRIEGENAWRYDGPGVNPMKQEHVNLVNAIVNDEPLNDGYHGAVASFTAVFGRMATYSGQELDWDEAVEKGPDEMPERLAWDADPPVLPDEDGGFESKVPQPGIYQAY